MVQRRQTNSIRDRRKEGGWLKAEVEIREECRGTRAVVEEKLEYRQRFPDTGTKFVDQQITES